MSYFLLFCILAVVICILVMLIKFKQTSIRKAIGMNTQVQDTRNSHDQAKKIGAFIYNRLQVSGVDLVQQSAAARIDMDAYKRIMSGNDEGVMHLIRLCHASGCEIVIRQIGTNDLELGNNAEAPMDEGIFGTR